MTPKWAEPCEEPAWVKHQRRRGAKAKGLKFERDVGKALGPVAVHGQWFVYALDDGRPKWCQTDFLLKDHSYVWVVEVKLTLVSEAGEKLEHLYLPVVSRAYSLPARGIVLCKNLAPRLVKKAHVCEHLGEAYQLPATKAGSFPIVHWLGHTPLRGDYL